MTDSRIAIEAMDLLLRSDARVLGSRLDEWLTTNDPDVLSVVYLAISRAEGRIDDGIEPKTYFALVAKLLRVLPDQPGNSGYSLGSYDAASIYAAFLRQCATDESMPGRAHLLRVAVDDLEEAYRQGDENRRRCIVDGALEHSFFDPVVRAAFAGWQRDPVLKVAFDEAAEWAQE